MSSNIDSKIVQSLFYIYFEIITTTMTVLNFWSVNDVMIREDLFIILYY